MVPSRWRQWVGGLSKASHQQRTGRSCNVRVKLNLETLEDRTLPSASVIATIPVGTNPQGLAVNAATNRAYVANTGSGTVSVINDLTNTVVTTINLGAGSNPNAVGINTTTNRVFVVQANTDGTNSSVAVIDGTPASPTENTVIATIPIPGRFVGFAGSIAVNPNTNKVYVPSFDPGGQIEVINGATNTLQTAIAVASNPISAAVDPTTNTIYVGHGSFFHRNQITIVNGATNAVSNGPAVGLSQSAIGVDPTTHRLYVHKGDTSRGSPVGIVVVDTTTNTILSTVTPAAAGQAFGFGNVAVNTQINRIYVAEQDPAAYDVAVINGAPGGPTTDTLAATVGVGTQPKGIGVDPASNHIFVANTGSGTVSVIADQPSTVYVNASFANPVVGQDPDGAGPATDFGYDAFATIQAGVNAVASGGTVNVAAGTYIESVSIAKPLTLQGAGNTTLITPPSGNGISVTSGGDNVTISSLKITGAASDGIDASGVDSLTLTSVEADNNGTEGFDLHSLTGTTTLTNDVALDNNDDGIYAKNVDTLSVSGGSYNNSTVYDGIYLAPGTIGAATFTNVAANGNNSDNLLSNASVTTFTISGGSYNNSPNAAGIHLNSGGIGTATLTNVTASGNNFSDLLTDTNVTTLNVSGGSYNNSVQNNGIHLEAGTIDSATITNATVNGNNGSNLLVDSAVTTSLDVSGGTYNNGYNGISLYGPIGSATFSNVTATGNFHSGLLSNADVTTLDVSGGSYNNSTDLNGIYLSSGTVGTATFTNVTATGNGGSNLLVDNTMTTLSVSGGTYNGSVFNSGLRLRSGSVGSASFSNVTATGNNENGLSIESDTTATVSGGSYSTNTLAGINLSAGTTAISSATINSNTTGVDVSGVATLTNNTLLNNTTGIFVHAGGSLTLSGTNHITNGTVGLQVDGLTSTVSGSTVGTTAFSGQSSYYIQLTNNALQGPQVLDASAATFEGVTGPNMNNAQYTAAQAKLFHFPNDPNVGLIVLRTGVAYMQNNNLMVIGTSNADVITVNSNNKANVTVMLGRTPLTNPAGGPFNLQASGGHVVVFGLAGNDFIQTPGFVSAEVYGGDGNDTIFGGSGNDVLNGGPGNDYIRAGSGDSILIGGGGNDYLVGGRGSDILIAGKLVPNGGNPTFPTYSVLEAALTAWKNGGTFNPSALNALFSQFVHPDLVSERCTVVAGSGHDAFFYRKNTMHGAADVLSGNLTGDDLFAL